MLWVAEGQYTIFMEEIQPVEVLGGAFVFARHPRVQGKLLAMIQGEVWELIWVNWSSGQDSAAHGCELGKAIPCRAVQAAGRRGREKSHPLVTKHCL